ncbi:hypothetical protein [Risungbinella massiliensis]|uniref:hypothetical protein n=1 Tax=Risungbinella massiliensis TaxID=1329796 RepID=UPI0005CC6931|nr:hypothetical protein [Risungbinella massiliensis]
MEKGLNNKDINKNNNFDTNQIFFIQRWLELLNTNTHSKYSVRYLNSHQALKEVVYVCEGMLNGDIKCNDHHLKLVIDEARSIVESDDLLKREAKTHHKIIIRSLSSCPKATQKPQMHSIVYQLGYVIRYLDTCYLEWIVKRIKVLLFESESISNIKVKELKEIDNLILILVSELLGKGWSIVKLYELIKENLLPQRDDSEKWEIFIKTILSDPNDYICLFRFESPPSKGLQAKMLDFELDLLNGDTVLMEYSDSKLISHISSDREYLRVIVRVFDQHSAINSAWLQVIQKIDILRFYGYVLPEINKTPIVLWPDGRQFTRNVNVSLVLNKKKYHAPETLLDKIRLQIKKSNSESINRKIKSLFEFNRISEESLAPQSTFLNLWIALESFVQTKEKDGGIDNVKMVVGATASHNYIYSLVKNFLEDCNRCNLEILEEESGNSIRIGRLKVYEALPLLLDNSKKEGITTNCYNVNILLGYRYRQLSEILSEGKKASKVIELHKENVVRHLQRLYRVRNAIVHSAEVHYNINLFIKHLSDYIEATMSVVLHRLEDHDFNTLEEVFPMVRDSVESTIEILKSSNDLEEEEYYNLLINGAF